MKCILKKINKQTKEKKEKKILNGKAQELDEVKPFSLRGLFVHLSGMPVSEV